MFWNGASETDNIADKVAAFLLVEKELQGEQFWGPGNRDEERRISWPISVEGEMFGATLALTAYPDEPEQRFTITLNLPPCVWRLDMDPDYKRHRNPYDRGERLGTHTISGPNYHSWDDNRHLATPSRLPDKLTCARPLPTGFRTFERALRWFCGETKIILPNNQMVELPPRERLV